MHLKEGRLLSARTAIVSAMMGCVLSGAVSAAPLSHVQFLGDNTNGTNHISALQGTVTSIDGNFVYAISVTEGAITIFSRDKSSKLLNFVGEVIENTSTHQGIHSPTSILVSPDNKYLYAIGIEAGSSDHIIAVFERDELTGGLTAVQSYKGRGLNNPAEIIVPKDGNQIYVSSWNGNSFTVLKRAVNGILSELQFILKPSQSVPSTYDYVHCATLSPDQSNVYVALEDTNIPGATIVHYRRDLATGLLTFVDKIDSSVADLKKADTITGIEVSPDGKFLYVTNTGGGNGADTVPANILSFSISATGSLALVDRYFVNDPTGNPIKLYWPENIEISNNGKLAYVADDVTDSLVLFSRNQITGALTYFGAEHSNKDGVVDTREAKRVELSPDNTSAFISGQWGLTVFDAYTSLSITNTPSAASVAPDATISYSLQVTNNHSAVAHHTTITFTPPAGTSIATITPSSSSTICSQAEGVASCEVGNLVVKAAEKIVITIIAPASVGSINATASVAADEVDDNLGDNSATASISIADSAAPATSPGSGASAGTNTGTSASTPPTATSSDSASPAPKKKGGGGSFDWITAIATSLLALYSAMKRIGK
ncbi:MAG: conserved repeat protein [Verrucomicrobiaceae bacterium]|nr:conserved repeat protein [Verrucomicrobiaceae bacterium]